MKYKVGDRVRIKTWGAMEKEFGGGTSSTGYSQINCKSVFVDKMEKDLQYIASDRIVTIREIKLSSQVYHMWNLGWNWSDDMIECLEEEWLERERKKLASAEIERFLLMDFE